MVHINDNAINKGRIPLSPLKLVVADFVLLSLCFFIVYFFKTGGFMLPDRYWGLLVLFYSCWFLTSLISKKFQPDEYSDFRSGLKTVFRSACYLAYCISFIIVFFHFTEFSRSQVFVTAALLFALNVAAWALFSAFLLKKPEIRADEAASESVKSTAPHAQKFSYPLMALDLLLLILAFLAISIIKRGHLELPPEYDQLLMILLGLWFLSALPTRKYFISKTAKAVDIFWQWQKSGLIMLASLAVVVFAFRLFHFSRFQGFGTIGLLMILEALLLFFMFAGRKEKGEAKDIESVEQVRQVLDQEPVDTDIDIESIRQKLFAPARFALEDNLGANWRAVYQFIGDHADIDEILTFETAVERIYEPIGQRINTSPARLFVNLHKLNDVRRLNQFFLEIHKALLPGGYFVGYAHTIRTHHQYVYEKYPRLIAHLIYGADFLFKRVAAQAKTSLF
ncbi:MAG: hypothetical protein ACLFNW_11105 [Desulfobacterales bacterium]